MGIFLKRLEKLKFILVLIVLQVTVLLSNTFATINMMSFKANYYNKIEESIPLKNTFYIWGGYGDSKKSNLARKEIFELITKSDYIKESMVAYEQSSLPFSRVTINKSYYDNISNYIIGEGFIEKDFEKSIDVGMNVGKGNVVNVIAGTNLKNKYALGDEVEDSNSGVIFKIVGFLDKDIFYRESGAIIGKSLKNKFIIPGSFYDFPDENFSMVVNYTTFTLKDDVDIDKFKERIDTIAEKAGLNYDFLSAEKIANDYYDLINSKLQYTRLKTVISWIISCALIIMSLNYIVKENFGFFGVMCLLGAKKRIIITFMSILFLSIVTLGLAFGNYMSLFRVDTLLQEYINNIITTNLLLANVIVIATICISFLLSLAKILRITPYELIKGEKR